MHGRKRAEYKAQMDNPKVSAALEQKAQQWYMLSKTLIKRRNADVAADSKQAAETLNLVTKVLIVNPDPSWLWNMRRELLPLLSSPVDSEESATTNSKNNVQPELDLTAQCLQRNHKAYSAWFHRKWAVNKFMIQQIKCKDSQVELELLDSELELCSTFLMLDERNFHCWNYRRFVVAAKAVSITRTASIGIEINGSWAVAASMWRDDDNIENKNKNKDDELLDVLMGAQIASRSTVERLNDGQEMVRIPPFSDKLHDLLQAEWDFSRTKIEQNFSNCSAFHYRSKLLPIFYSDGLLQEELEFIQNAIFTEPDDQTAWWYHRFILDYASSKVPETEFAEILHSESELISELVEDADGNCKWGLLALHMMASKQLERMIGVNCNNSGDDEDSISRKREELNSYLEQLMKLDPSRQFRYQSMTV